MAQTYWTIPSGIDLQSFLKKNPPKFKYKIDYFYYIIDYLCSKGMELEDLDNNAGFINMSAHKLLQFNHEYKNYVAHLSKHGLIRHDNKYIVGKKSSGYQLGKFQQSYIQEIPIIDFVCIKKIIRERGEDNRIIKSTCKKYHYLTKWLNEHLVIDAVGAKNKVEELFPEQTGTVRGTLKGKPSSTSKRFKALYSIDKMSKNDFYYSVDDNVGRFHSNLTNIKRELRHFIASIATTVGNEEYISQIIKEEIDKLTGLKALVGHENWG